MKSIIRMLTLSLISLPLPALSSEHEIFGFVKMGMGIEEVKELKRPIAPEIERPNYLSYNEFKGDDDYKIELFFYPKNKAGERTEPFMALGQITLCLKSRYEQPEDYLAFYNNLVLRLSKIHGDPTDIYLKGVNSQYNTADRQLWINGISNGTISSETTWRDSTYKAKVSIHPLEENQEEHQALKPAICINFEDSKYKN